MSLIKREPMSFLSRMQQELNHFFDGRDHFPSVFAEGEPFFSARWMPSIDIKEDDAQYTVTADVPGVDAKDIEVSMEESVLTIKGERKSEKEENKKNYHRRECVMGSFERSFRMPAAADADRITASNKDGVLTVIIPKKKVEKPKTVKIDVGK